ncbi:MAG: peptidase M14 carboxypeptidase [Planctomycetota bacterium]|nr:MAG: peptidase M14 carboxypeptidase [Planctomycetota bacterium]
MPRRPLCSLILALAALPCPAGEPQEFPLPDFDVEKAKATYAIAVPPGYDAKTAWPLIVDLHGAIAPSAKGGSLTVREVWSRFSLQVPCLVAAPNSRTRAWGMIEGERDDVAYVAAVLADVKKRYTIDLKRVYLAGFSSGSDFLCSGGLQLGGEFAGSLVVCPGPSNVVGLSDGSLLKAKAFPFLFVTGEEDVVRKDGSWEAFLAIDRAGGRAMYREVPETDHRFASVEEYARLFRYLEFLAGNRTEDDLAVAKEAAASGDWLRASTHAAREESAEAKAIFADLEIKTSVLADEAAKVEATKEPGRAFESWWRVRTQGARFPDLAARAQKQLDALENAPGSLYRARTEWLVAKRLWTWDRYLGNRQVTEHLKDLAKRFPGRARLASLGKSVQGRDILVLEITDRSAGAPEEKPAVWVQGALHGNEASAAMTALYVAWQLAANPARSRGTDKVVARTTFYVVPAASPDAFAHFMGGPCTRWRPRYNYRPFDADGDGKTDEDGYEDLDGDGEIGLMWKPDDKGDFVLKGGRVVRGDGAKRFSFAGREGVDDDGDGKYSEDPAGGVDLNRNFPVGFKVRKEFEGSHGPEAASEPETQAIMKAVAARPNIALFLDVHNDGKCLFFWRPGEDKALFEAIAARGEKTLGYPPAPLDHEGAGLAIAWAFGARGIPSLILELEPREWSEDRFVPAKPFKHPQLGEILLGGDDRKLSARNPEPAALREIARKSWEWIKDEAERLPRLELVDPVIEATEGGFEVRATLQNAGEMPTDTWKAVALKLSAPVAFEAEGLAEATAVERLAGGASAEVRVKIASATGPVTLIVRHPRAGVVRLPVRPPTSETRPIRKDYTIEDGFATPDKAVPAENEFFRKGVPVRELGPGFECSLKRPRMKVAVVLGEWKDRRHSFGREEIERSFFSKGAGPGTSPTGQPTYGSLRDFYAEMSGSTFDATGTVFDWVLLPGSWTGMRDASFGSDVVERELARAVLARDGKAALDGFDAIVFLWAGNPVARTSALWPMRLSLKDRPGVVAFKAGERYRGHFAPIGVACHELAHTFGVDDKYGLGATKNPLGPFCLIAYGTHGAAPSAEARPFHLCAWCKQCIGWLRPVTVDPARPQKLALRPVNFDPGESFRVLLKPDGSEYLLLENRRREGFMSDLPCEGLFVLRVGPNDRPASPQTRVQLIPAHGLDPARRGIPADEGHVAWPQEGRTELSEGSAALRAIRRVDDVIYFEISSGK